MNFKRSFNKLNMIKKQTVINHILNKNENTITDAPYCVSGWIRTVRHANKGNIIFVELNDGSTFKNLQIVIDKKYFESLTFMTGMGCRFVGKLTKSVGRKQNVEMLIGQNDAIEIFSPLNYLPISKKEHSMEFLRENSHLKSLTQFSCALNNIRNILFKATHSFFQRKKFIWINVPIITPLDCEGGGEMFELKDDKFFNKKVYLSVSGQLYAEALCQGMSRVYSFGPTFRAEKSNTSRHLSEFWMVEPEIAFAKFEDICKISEQYLKFCISKVLDSPELTYFLEKDYQLEKRLMTIAESEIKKIQYKDAISILIEDIKSKKYQTKREVKYGIDLNSEEEQYLAMKFNTLIITDFPKEIKPFYMKENESSNTVSSFDLLVPKIGEIIGGSERETNYEKLKNRLKENDIEKYKWYLDLRTYGSVPHSGFGLGFERLLMLCTGIENIKDTIPFYRTYSHADF